MRRPSRIGREQVGEAARDHQRHHPRPHGSRHLIKSDELATAEPAQVIRLPVMLSLADRPDHTGPPSLRPAL
jgi:hypothetical protein